MMMMINNNNNNNNDISLIFTADNPQDSRSRQTHT